MVICQIDLSDHYKNMVAFSPAEESSGKEKAHIPVLCNGTLLNSNRNFLECYVRIRPEDGFSEDQT